jgi:1,4-dihydroxy-6-naphthoate synthase
MPLIVDVMVKKITLGFSPCPNDTFIFDALVNNKIDTEGLDFEYILLDIEELNKRAFMNDLDVTKISFHAYYFLTSNYILLDSGSALGQNCGPLLISKKKYSLQETDKLTVAVPGKYTTANFLLKFAFPNISSKKLMLFSDIEKAVLEERADAGVIIHENRFTYESKGLIKIADLGEIWESRTRQPIPLGGIIAKKTLPESIISKINKLVRQSVAYAFANPVSSKSFVKSHSQELDDEVIKKHIELYVNDFSLSLGEKGKIAIDTFMKIADEQAKND